MATAGSAGSPDPAASLKAEQAEAERRKEEREAARRAARLARAEVARERRAAYDQRLTREVLWAGDGVSSRLTGVPGDEARLARRGLPPLRDAADLAAHLGIDLRALRWLTYHRDVSPVVHYRQFEVPKAKGGTRVISAPRPRLRAALDRVRETLLSRLPPTPQAQAFVKGRSTVTNARPHLRQAVLVKVDIRDFFGSIGFPRIRGLFEALGYPGQVATLLGLLCTEAPRVEVDLDGKRWWVATGARALPQGAPTSPELTNQIARRLDARLSGFAKKHGWVYTRYADDLTFSRKVEAEGDVRRLLGTARAVLEAEGFRLNPEKIFVARKGRQQRVTGVVVNDVVSLDRGSLRRFRAAVHRVTEKEKRWRSPAERAAMLGFACYVKMVKPALGQAWLDALSRVTTS